MKMQYETDRSRTALQYLRQFESDWEARVETGIEENR